MNKKRIMIVDLDAHQGNGYERDLLGDNQVYIIDFYNHDIYPNDRYAKQAIRKDAKIYSRTTDEDFIQQVKGLSQDFAIF